MGKRRFYVTMILTVGSAAWAMYTLPDTIEAAEAARPGSHGLRAGTHARTGASSNGFATLPDVDAMLELARANARALEHPTESGLIVYTPDTDGDLDALRDSAHRHAPHKREKH